MCDVIIPFFLTCCSSHPLSASSSLLSPICHSLPSPFCIFPLPPLSNPPQLPPVPIADGGPWGE